MKPEPDLPLHHDHLVYSVASLLKRSGAKGLAIDELPAADRQQLERERRELRESLKADPPPDRVPHVEETQRERIEEAVERTRARERQLLERRSGSAAGATVASAPRSSSCSRTSARNASVSRTGSAKH